MKESWPSFNQEFDFSLSKTDSSSISNTGVKFVSFTVYAILESFSGKQSATSSLKKRFLMFTGKKSELTRNKMRVSRRLSINNRRTIGAITYNLNSKTFNQKMKNDYVSTADIWRRLEPITSGIQHTMVCILYFGNFIIITNNIKFEILFECPIQRDVLKQIM